MSEKKKKGTISALLKERPKRGRPPRPVSRHNVYVALSEAQKACMQSLGDKLPKKFGRADVPDLAVILLAVRFEGLRRAVADREREIPEGIVDLDSLYLLWDLSLPNHNAELKWTSVRVSPQQAIELGRVHGIFNTLFGANRSHVFALGLALLAGFMGDGQLPNRPYQSMQELQEQITRVYL